MTQVTETVARGILAGHGYTNNEVRQLAHHWLATRGQAPAPVLHLVNDAFAEVAMAYPKAFALHKVGLADTAVREALAVPSPHAAQQAPAQAAPAAVVGPSEFPHERMDAVALGRYKVVSSDQSMFYRFAVVAGDGTQQLYIGREADCQNMARKFAGAFLDGAFAHNSMTVAPATQPSPQLSPTAQAAESVPVLPDFDTVEQHIYGACCRYITQDMLEPIHNLIRDAIDADRAARAAQEGKSHGAQGDKLLTVAERNIRSFLRSATFKSESDREAALNCVDVLWEAARAPADSVQEDAARYRWLRINAIGAFRTNDGKGPVSVYHLAKIPAIPGIPEETDAAIDAARAAQEGKSHEQ